MTNIVFTIATESYVPLAITLGKSVIKHNPKTRFVLALIGKIEKIDNSLLGPSIEVIMISSKNIDGFSEMREKYNDFEFSVALKPYVADYLLKLNPANKVLFLDADIMVFDSLDRVFSLLNDNSTMITPHAMSPLPADGCTPNDLNFLNAGIYNAGFFAVKNCSNAFGFLGWWKSQLYNECKHDLCNGRFVDQIWLNLVPLYFKNVHILKDWGYNVGHWNIHEQDIRLVNGRFLINDLTPLVCFHFSGFVPHPLDNISKHQNRFLFREKPDMLPLFEQYREALYANGYVFEKNDDNIASRPSGFPVCSFAKRILNGIINRLPC